MEAMKRMKTTTPDIIDFVTDANLLGLGLSDAQETLLRAIYGGLAVPVDPYP